MRVILTILVAALFSGCYTEKKFTNQLHKGSIYYPGVVAKKARAMFPCLPTDSVTVYESDSADYQGVINQLQGDLMDSYLHADSLANMLANGDTVCRRYSSIIIDLQKQIIALKQRVITLPPVIKTIRTEITTRDSAELFICQEKNDKLTNLLVDITADRDKYKSRSRKFMWILVGLALIIGVGAYYKIRKP